MSKNNMYDLLEKRYIQEADRVSIFERRKMLDEPTVEPSQPKIISMPTDSDSLEGGFDNLKKTVFNGMFSGGDPNQMKQDDMPEDNTEEIPGEMPPISDENPPEDMAQNTGEEVPQDDMSGEQPEDIPQNMSNDEMPDDTNPYDEPQVDEEIPQDDMGQNTGEEVPQDDMSADEEMPDDTNPYDETKPEETGDGVPQDDMYGDEETSDESNPEDEDESENKHDSDMLADLKYYRQQKDNNEDSSDENTEDNPDDNEDDFGVTSKKKSNSEDEVVEQGFPQQKAPQPQPTQFQMGQPGIIPQQPIQNPNTMDSQQPPVSFDPSTMASGMQPGLDPNNVMPQQPIQDPSMGAGMPPTGQPGMDPSMMGVQQPPIQDPSTMGGGMPPTMDPSMMQQGSGMPPAGQPGMDPSMMGAQQPQAMDPSMGAGMPPTGQPGMDPNSMGMGDPSMGGAAGMVPPGPPLSYNEVTRVYELKKIHSRLVSIDSYLSTILDSKLTKMRAYISKSIDLFNTVISNFGLFRDRIDGIIIGYYGFLKEIYDYLKEYMEEKESATEKSN